jgi:prophage maintenance system killer protein
MSEDDSDRVRLDAVLPRLTVILQQPIDFTRADTETSLAKIRLLTAVASYFNILAISDYGGRGGPVRGEGLVEQAIAAAFQTFEGIDPHPSHFEKAAVLLRGITQGHPFNDGNKRTGFLVASYYLRRVGYPFPDPLPIDEAERLCLKVSAGEIRDVIRIAHELERLWGHYESSSSQE